MNINFIVTNDVFPPAPRLHLFVDDKYVWDSGRLWGNNPSQLAKKLIEAAKQLDEVNDDHFTKLRAAFKNARSNESKQN